MSILNKKWKRGLVLLVLLIVLILIGKKVFGFFETSFETCDLGELNGQCGWSGFNGLEVVSNTAYDGVKSVKGNGGQAKHFGTLGYSDYLAIRIKTDDTFVSENKQTILGFFKDSTPYQYFTLKGTNFYKTASTTAPNLLFENVSPNTWQTFYFEWNGNDYKFKVGLNEQSSDWFNGEVQWTNGLDGFWIQSSGCEGHIYYDYITEEQQIAEEPLIYGDSPESGTEITNLDTDIIIKYEGFDWDIYSGFTLVMKEHNSKISSKALIYQSDDLDENGSGQVPVSGRMFGIDVNSRWDLEAIAFGSQLDVEGGMFLTGLGYVDFYTENLVYPDYYLNFNVEGLAQLYPFSEPENWYLENVDRFSEPTEFFTAVIGLVSPIFQKVGEFGTRTQIIFSTADAYQRGYALGEVFPKIKGYTEKISEFFGGFPIVSFFIAIILIMSAIFIIRLIMKFIPFFG